MLPNLRYLQVIRSCSRLNESYLIVWQCDAESALVLLPLVSKLSILDTYNAQGPYLLRVAVPGGVLLALRSLSIIRDSGYSPKPREGHRWREDENGGVSQADPKKPSRQFDGNYIMSISKAAPNLEELELMGTSDDTLVSFLLVMDVIRSQCRIPSPLPCPGSQSYNVSPSLALSISWTNPSLHGPLIGQTTLSSSSLSAVSPRKVMGSMLLRASMMLHEI